MRGGGRRTGKKHFDKKTARQKTKQAYKKILQIYKHRPATGQTTFRNLL
jgi:hypothetical protein